MQIVNAKGKKMKLVYIAGPYTGKNMNEVFNNIQRAREVAETMASQRIAFICPHMNSALMDGVVDDSFFLEMGLEHLERCDAIFMMGGHESSSGSKAELKKAKAIGMMIFHSHELCQLIDWYHSD